MVAELSLTDLARICELQEIKVKCTDEAKPLQMVVGQPRANQALSFGVNVREAGFNIYAAGRSGTGKTTSIRLFINEITKDMPTPSDCCYVHNFNDEYQPRILLCPAGVGRQLKNDMREFIAAARVSISQLFQGEGYAAKREEISERVNDKRKQVIDNMEQVAEKAGFTMQLTPVGISLVPFVDGQPLSEEEFASKPPEVRSKITQKREQLLHDLTPLMRQMRVLQTDLTAQVYEFDRDVALYAVEHLMSDLLEKYKPYDEIITYLNDIRNQMMDDLDAFRNRTGPGEKTSPQEIASQELALRVYEINVIVDNSELKGAPMITEDNPTFDNLLGRIEKESVLGTLTTDFTLIRGGSLHRSNGGFLILRAEQLLRDLNVYEGLKRALKNKEIRIEDMQQRLGYVNVRTLSPSPIPLDVKVVLIGESDTYEALFKYDPEFRELFKVKADFDYTMDRTQENVQNYAGFLCGLVQKENLKHLDASAIARVVDYGCRLAEDQEKLSTQFGAVADMVREAHFYAQQGNSEEISASHIEKAIDAKIYRSNLIQQKLQEYIRRGVILVSTKGKVVGQVNGLSVLELGDFAFGTPSRITVTVGMGKEGLVDVQREANMSGPIHGKGVMIIAGYLADMFASNKPLTLSARIVFEQNYEGVEGDSASSTELYALLSAISGVPITQNFAVTGSVNQKGEIQPIGGVNEKIEGYFEVCKARGLTGEQAVLIPQSNVKNLMLKQEVRNAVKEHMFHIYAANTIQEGIEVLTGMSAGKREPDGSYQDNTIFGLVDGRLREMAETAKAFRTTNL